MRHVLTTVASLALLASPAWAEAPPPREALRLRWSAPPGCPSADEVRVASLRGADADRKAHAGGDAKGILEADAEVERRSGVSWRVRLRTRRGSTTGEREIEASTCGGVADATAVVLALALVPPQDDVDAAAPAPPASAPAPPTPAREMPSSARRPGPASSAHAAALGASAAIDAATLPSTAAGGSLSLAWTPGRFRLEIDARRWGAQSAGVSASTAGARFSTSSVGGRACWAAFRSAIADVGPCAGTDVHIISAEGFGADSNLTADATWTAVTAGVLGRLPLTSWLALRGRVEAAAPLTRPTFVVENEGDVHRPPTLGAAASFGAEVDFL